MRRWIASFYSDRIDLRPSGGCIVTALDRDDAANKAKAFRASARIAVITPVCAEKFSALSQGTRERFESSMDRTLREEELEELTELVASELRALAN